MIISLEPAIYKNCWAYLKKQELNGSFEERVIQCCGSLYDPSLSIGKNLREYIDITQQWYNIITRGLNYLLPFVWISRSPKVFSQAHDVVDANDIVANDLWEVIKELYNDDINLRFANPTYSDLYELGHYLMWWYGHQLRLANNLLAEHRSIMFAAATK